MYHYQNIKSYERDKTKPEAATEMHPSEGTCDVWLKMTHDKPTSNEEAITAAKIYQPNSFKNKSRSWLRSFLSEYAQHIKSLVSVCKSVNNTNNFDLDNTYCRFPMCSQYIFLIFFNSGLQHFFKSKSYCGIHKTGSRS